jgi:hypothetical protein
MSKFRTTLIEGKFLLYMLSTAIMPLFIITMLLLSLHLTLGLTLQTLHHPSMVYSPVCTLWHTPT